MFRILESKPLNTSREASTPSSDTYDWWKVTELQIVLARDTFDISAAIQGELGDVSDGVAKFLAMSLSHYLLNNTA